MGEGRGVTPLRILVVEDDPLIGMLLGELLTEMGHQVCGVEREEAAAVAAAGAMKPDLLIVDARLGEGSGLRVVDAARLDGRLHHLFTTGDAPRVRAARPDSVVVQKPYDEAILAEAMVRAMAAP